MTGASSSAAGRQARSKLLAAYAIIYVVWGSTYLAIRFAIDGLPPFLMAASRFVIAGTGLYLWARLRGASRPTQLQWRHAAIVGVLLLLGGNGGVVWAEQHVPSGIVALLVATEPLWIAILDWLRPGGKRPSTRAIVGLVTGLVGVAVLVGPGALLGTGDVDLLGAVVVILAALSWAMGSLWAVRAPAEGTPRSAPLRSAMQMLAGGAALFLAGSVAGELPTLSTTTISGSALVAVLYLIVFGSIIGYSAYAWLLTVEPPSRVSTYAFVNPAVAVLLGWLVAGEQFSPASLVAAAFIVTAVVLIVTAPQRPSAVASATLPRTTDAPKGPPGVAATDDPSSGVRTRTLPPRRLSARDRKRSSA